MYHKDMRVQANSIIDRYSCHAKPMLRPAPLIVVMDDMNLGADGVHQLIRFYIHVPSLCI